MELFSFLRTLFIGMAFGSAFIALFSGDDEKSRRFTGFGTIFALLAIASAMVAKG